MSRVAAAVLSTPHRFTTVAATTAATATSRIALGAAYAPTVSAIAAQLASLPATKPQPARKPHPAPSRARPYA